jgi:hypothetical protein
MTKEQLFARAHANRKTVSVDGVTLRSPLAGDWLDYQELIRTLPEHSFDHVVRLVSITAVDDEGKPLLSEADCRQLDTDTAMTLFRRAAELVKVGAEVETKQGES